MALESLLDRIASFIRRRRERRNAEIERRRAAERQRQRDFLYDLGNSFEDTVIGVFDPQRFELVHRTSTDRESGRRYEPGMELPDLRFRERSTGRCFWVECKYRARTMEHVEIEWCTERQLRRYRATAMEYREPVLVVIGVGNTGRMYCLDVSGLRWTVLYYGTYKDRKIVGTVRSLDSLLDVAGYDESGAVKAYQQRDSTHRMDRPHPF